jgi:hypothetical protein
MQVHERPALVADDDVGEAVAVDVARDDLRADARFVVDEIRNEVDGPVGVARQPEPVEYRRVVAVGIAGASVRPEALARDDVRARRRPCR